MNAGDVVLLDGVRYVIVRTWPTRKNGRWDYVCELALPSEPNKVVYINVDRKLLRHEI